MRLVHLVGSAWSGAGIVGGILVCGACGGNGAVTYGAPPGNVDAGMIGVDQFVSGAGVGQVCDASNACRAGLSCTSGKCAPGHASPAGSPCKISDECASGAFCSPLGICAPGGTAVANAGCQSDANCAVGLRCDLVGLSAQCEAEGMGDLGATCAASSDCFGGLSCIGKACGTYPPPGFPTPWVGETCEDVTGPTVAYFRVPRGTGDGDFYRLPFPNDVRLKSGHPDLSNHPTPGAALLGFDVVDRYLRDVEQNTDGFSTYPTVFFRFSASVDFNSLKLDSALQWIDVTPGSPRAQVGFGWTATTGRNAYLCANSVKIRPPEGAPLVPGHTYAIIMTTQVVDANEAAIQQSADLTALLSKTPPADATLAAAYPAYKPLRDYLAAAPAPVPTVLNATVFTVGHPTLVPSKMAVAIATGAKPTAVSWVKCGGAAPSPCPQAAAERACPAMANPAFDELHALVTLPIFQKGNEPYLTPDDGGGFVLEADGTPAVQRAEQVCMSLTVPTGTAMPASGWPLLIYAHGTGGSFRSQAVDGVAGRLASIDDGSGTLVHAAVIGIDQVEHGTRRGASTQSPDNLFFNFANPSAARGNPLQGAADQISLARFAASLDLTAALSPTATEIKFGRIAFWGHSQGATEGGIAMSYDGTATGLVLSGEGASLIDALLNKKSPVDVADAIPIALQDSQPVDIYHPVLGILQNAIDVADPLNHAATLASVPIAPALAKSLFQPFGIGDTYAPQETEKTFALAANLGVEAPPAGVTQVPISGATLLPSPAGANVTVGTGMFTAIVREYQPGTYDGHFVAYQNADASKDVDRFLYDVLSGKTPQVGR